MASLHYDNRLTFPVSRSSFPVFVFPAPLALCVWVALWGGPREGAKRYEAQAFPICGGETPADRGEPPFSRGRVSVGLSRWQARAPQKERASRIQAEHPVRH